MGLIPNAEELHRLDIDPAITRLNAETIPALQSALQAVLHDELAMLPMLLQDANDSVRAALATATVDVQSTLNSLDGWHVTIKPSGPILALTGEVEVTLSKPKEKA